MKRSIAEPGIFSGPAIEICQETVKGEYDIIMMQ
jgi:hypothetical protein